MDKKDSGLNKFSAAVLSIFLRLPFDNCGFTKGARRAFPQMGKGEYSAAQRAFQGRAQVLAKGGLSDDLGAEGSKSELCDFKALLAEGNAHHRDAEETAQHGGLQCQRKAGEQQPNDVQQG